MKRRALLLTATLGLLFATAARAQTLKGIRKEFTKVGERVIPATVIVKALESRLKGNPGSTGVIVHPDGYILSDADATLTHFTKDEKGEETVKHHGVDATVILPAPDHRSFQAVVVRRDAESDTTLLKILKPPKDLPFVPIGTSDTLEVGSFNIVVGNAFGQGAEGEPALSMGVVSALVGRDLPGAGRYETIYTSAAVNPGTNGGPCVDAEGRVVGIVSTWERDPTSPFRALGIVTPISRIRTRYESVENFETVFPNLPRRPPRSDEAAVMEKAFSIIARHAYSSLVSIEVDRGDAKATYTVGNPMARFDKEAPKTIEVPHYPGPYSGVVLSADGYVLTCTASLWKFTKIKSVTVHLPDGRSLPGKLLGRDRYRGVALLKVEAEGLTPLPVATKKEMVVGRFALAVANPFGEKRQGAPLFTFGVVSGLHRLNKDMDAIQTDAGMTDGMVGGALVTLEGKLLGLNLRGNPDLQGNPDRFGRNSGIGFAIPMSAIEASLPELKEGRNVEPGHMGIAWPVKNKDGDIVFTMVSPTGPAGKAGLKKGDVLVEVDGKSVRRHFSTPEEFIDYVRSRSPGDRLTLLVQRGRETTEIQMTLGSRPED